jgi:inorganic triphosphatase YgiF
MARERELKLEVEPAAVRVITDWLRAHGAKRHTARATRAIYFDTEDLALHNSGITLRIRHAGDRYTQTIKHSAGRASGFFDRAEWACPVEGFSPDFSAARKTHLKEFSDPNLSQSLRPAFTVETRRTPFDIPGESRMAFTIDRGEIIAGGRRQKFCEIEIESLDGHVGGLFRTARALSRIAPVQPGIQSKSGRGYGLLQEGGRVFRAHDVALSRNMPCEDAFRLIARDCLHQLAANGPGTQEGTPEALHQMRVGLRRLRACISLFSGMLDDVETAGIKEGLRWLGRSLGAARDVDVLIDETLQRDFAMGGGAIPESLQLRLEAGRKRAHAAVQKALQSARFRRLMLDTVSWLECGAWRDTENKAAKARRAQPVKKHAAAELHRRHRKLTKRAADLKKLSPEERHKFRIGAKKLRYGVEFFGGIFTGHKHARRRSALLGALKDLQNALGSLNDIATREQLLSQFSKEISPAFRSMLTAATEIRAAKLLDEGAAAAQAILEAKPFWE